MAKLDSTIVYGDLNTTANLNVDGDINVGVASISNFGGTVNNQGRLELNVANAGSPQVGFTDNGDVSWAIGADDGDNSFKIHGSATAVIPTINNLVSPLFEIATTGIATFANCIFAATPAATCDNTTVATTAFVKAQNYGTSNLALGTTSSTAYRGDLGNTAYNHSQNNSQAHTDYLRNNVSDTSTGTITAAGFNAIGTVCVGTGVYFTQGGSRTICIEQATDGAAGDNLYICAGTADDFFAPFPYASYVGGCTHIFGGRGSSEDWDAGQGGNICICGGSGGVSDCCFQGGCGGDINIQGGSGGFGALETASSGRIYLNSITYLCGTTTYLWHGGTYSGYISSSCIYTTLPICTTSTFRTSGGGYGFCGGTSCGTATDWVATSDCRIKKNIKPITTALSKVDALCGVCYELCEDGSKDMGLIAQAVEIVEPRLVAHGEPIEEYKKYGIEDEILSLKYDKFAGLFVEAIKELKQQNECLQLQINELRKK